MQRSIGSPLLSRIARDSNGMDVVMNKKSCSRPDVASISDELCFLLLFFSLSQSGCFIVSFVILGFLIFPIRILSVHCLVKGVVSKVLPPWPPFSFVAGQLTTHSSSPVLVIQNTQQHYLPVSLGVLFYLFLFWLSSSSKAHTHTHTLTTFPTSAYKSYHQKWFHFSAKRCACVSVPSPIPLQPTFFS